MDFALTEEQGFIRDTIQKVVAKECEREAIKRMDEEKIFPENLFRKVADIGLCALTVPEAYGGGGPNTLGAVIVTAELAAIYPALAGIFATQCLCGGQVIADLGTEAQKKRYLPGVIDGSALMTLALMEPEQGYEETGSRTTARADGENLILDGTKTFVRMADRAAFMITRVTIGSPGGVPAFVIVDVSSPGIGIRSLEQVGFHGMSLCEVSLSSVAIPVSERLGGDANASTEQKKWEQVMSAEHLAVAACGMGLARGAYDYALNYARERVQFGRPIIKFGAIQEMLVDMAQQTRVANLLTCQAASMVDQGRDCLAEILQARLAATEAARKAALHGVQIFGGYGYAMEYDAQRYLRDAMVLLSGGGTRQVLSNTLGFLWGY
jgi:alkylation response protein AidB-like acyl-CoA dehydrogenase